MSDNDAPGASTLELPEFYIARGGPFYKIQRQLGLITDDSWRIGFRVVIMVALTWAVPLLLALIAGSATGKPSDGPYLLELNAYARFLIAIALFILMEPRTEDRLRRLLSQFSEAPIIAPGSGRKASAAISSAGKSRDSMLAELVILLVAVTITFINYQRVLNHEASSWMMEQTQDGFAMTYAGYWAMSISSTIFWFLLLRWCYKLLIWSRLVSKLSSLEMRLVATHPDSYGGLGFVGLYPNAFAGLIFAISCVVAAGIAKGLIEGTFEPANYAYVMTAWLVIALAIFAYPLLVYNKPLTDLRERTVLSCNAQATQHFRAQEREILGNNVIANSDSDSTASSEVPDPSKIFTATMKLNTFIIRRSVLVPVSAAALIPLVIAGLPLLPLKELVQILKNLLLI